MVKGSIHTNHNKNDRRNMLNYRRVSKGRPGRGSLLLLVAQMSDGIKRSGGTVACVRRCLPLLQKNRIQMSLARLLHNDEVRMTHTLHIVRKSIESLRELFVARRKAQCCRKKQLSRQMMECCCPLACVTHRKADDKAPCEMRFNAKHTAQRNCCPFSIFFHRC